MTSHLAIVTAPRHPALDRITARRLQILRMVCQAMSNKDIARQLGITENAIKSQMRLLLALTQSRSRLGLAMWARDHGIN